MGFIDFIKDILRPGNGVDYPKPGDMVGVGQVIKGASVQQPLQNVRLISFRVGCWYFGDESG
ncbi:immunophilin [Aspergillus luchuensis]|uniref:Immunophilin n=1 Tax=Aspergillus kawachii TaxID=1069201 RepID=A0A146F4X3_ASPKA|nr:immunophilin [Aspergillus luchuensis]